MMLFMLGSLFGLALSSGVLWGETEARFYEVKPAEAGLKISCPFMLALGESGMIRAVITNTSNERVTPTIRAKISHADGARQVDEILDLAPGESQSMQWLVDTSDVIFNRLILVSIHQFRYRELPAHIGYCGILKYSLFSLSGVQTFVLLFAFSLAMILLGAVIWFYTHNPLDEAHSNIARAGSVIAVLCIATLFSVVLRWWGIALFLDVFSFLAVGLIIIEFTFFPSKTYTD
jgi:hypothetical protein